jgi:hypothetical protein
MTDTNQLKAKEAKVEQGEGTERGMSGGLFGRLVMLAVLGLFLVGGLGVLLLIRKPATASSTEILAVLATLFATVTALVGTYFGIKASSDTRREIDRATEATGVFAEQLASLMQTACVVSGIVLIYLRFPAIWPNLCFTIRRCGEPPVLAY